MFYFIASQQKLFMPELIHNIELLVNKTEQEIIQTDRKIRYNRDLVVNLAHEREERESQRQEEAMQIKKLSEILKTVDVCVISCNVLCGAFSVFLGICTNMPVSACLIPVPCTNMPVSACLIPVLNTFGGGGGGGGGGAGGGEANLGGTNDAAV